MYNSTVKNQFIYEIKNFIHSLLRKFQNKLLVFYYIHILNYKFDPYAIRNNVLDTLYYTIEKAINSKQFSKVIESFMNLHGYNFDKREKIVKKSYLGVDLFIKYTVYPVRVNDNEEFKIVKSGINVVVLQDNKVFMNVNVDFAE